MTGDADRRHERLTDATLVTEVINGSQDAFGAIFRRHGGAVHKLARRMVGEDASADDVTQDVLLWFFNNPDRFDPTRGSLVSYLLVRCRSRSVDLLRAESSRRRRQQDQTLTWERMPASANEVERAVCDAARADEIRQMMDTLTAPERDALQLAFFRNLSYRAVAAELGIPEGTAKSRIRSGLRRLRGNIDLMPTDDPAGAGTLSPA